MAVTIRPLAAESRPQWDVLWSEYLRFYETILAPEVTEGTWQRMLDPSEPQYGALAMDETGEAVGFVHFLTHRSSWSPTYYCYLEDLFVTEAARGMGAGRTLINHVQDWARAAGCTRLYWMTHDHNASARKLYDRIAQNVGLIEYRIPLQD